MVAVTLAGLFKIVKIVLSKSIAVEKVKDE
jgi:hypothetical protein